MLQANIIKRSMSPWSFPLVVVAKKDGTSRMWVDLRKLNKITIPTPFPLPLIVDIISLGQSKYISKLDLKFGFWKIALDPDDSEKRAFACHKGLFQFNVMPFGLCNATFYTSNDCCFTRIRTFCSALYRRHRYFLAYKRNSFRTYTKCFDRLKQHNLKLKLKKCSFSSRNSVFRIHH